MAEGAEVKDAAAAAGFVVPKPAIPSAPSGAPVTAATDVAPMAPSPAPLAAAADAGAGAGSDDAVPPALRPTEDAGAAVAAAEEAPSDTEPFVATASIRRAPPKKPNADGEVLAFAPIPKPNDPVGRSFFGKDDDADAAPKKSAAGAKVVPPSPGKAKVLMAVNMRAKPDNDAPSLKILGAGAKVQVVSCDMWCLVVADGKRGYIFKKFLDN
jgi:hypothetical protein